MSAALLSNILFLAPFALFIAAIVFFVVSNNQRRRAENRQRFAEVILKGNRRRSSGMTREEMKNRLLIEEDEAEGFKAHMQTAFEAMLKLVNFNKEETRKRLIQSGDRDPRALSRYIMQRGMGMVLGPVMLYALAVSAELHSGLALILSLVGILAGGIAVDAILDKAVAARNAKIQTELPVLLDLLTIHLEAGSSFDVALARASAGLKNSFPVAAQEILYLRRDLEMSVDRVGTLKEFSARMNTSAAKTFVSIVIQSEQRGNAIAPALRDLARESRKDALILVERKAQKIPTMMQLPMFLFILPAIFAAVISPAIFAALAEFGK